MFSECGKTLGSTLEASETGRGLEGFSESSPDYKIDFEKSKRREHVMGMSWVVLQKIVNCDHKKLKI